MFNKIDTLKPVNNAVTKITNILKIIAFKNKLFLTI